MASISMTNAGIVYSDSQTVTGASGATVGGQVLDHYEEGSWTPKIVSRAGGELSGTSYSDRDGEYTKIGRVVTVLGMMQLSSTSGTISSGDILIGNLPFTIADVINGTVYEGGGSFGEFSALNVNVSSLYLQPRSDSPQGLQIRSMAATATSGLSSFSYTSLSSTTSFRFFATYYTS